MAPPAALELADLLPDIQPTLIHPLAAGARKAAYVPGEVVLRVGEAEGPAVVSSGLLRGFVTSDSGRQATVRYLRRGRVIGLFSLFREMPITIVAIEESTVIHLDPAVVTRIAQENAEFAWSLARLCSDVAVDLAVAVRKFAFRTVKQRIAAYLLSFASSRKAVIGQRIARLTQQGLADSVGSVREVVARSLRELKSQGLIAVSPAGIVLLDEAGLRRLIEDDDPYW
jgi:CRP/FNR family transcriptional regulator, cyclic AMP receptor protein